jgi:hypothetical protein
MSEFTISEPMFPVKKLKIKKSLDDLIRNKSVITGKEVIHNLKEQEKRQRQFEQSVEFEEQNRKRK